MLNWILDLYFIFSADKQQKKDSVKCDQLAGQEQDEYGGSTDDEEPGDAQETAASASLPPGQISIFERLLESCLHRWEEDNSHSPSLALGKHLDSSSVAYIRGLNN